MRRCLVAVAALALLYAATPAHARPSDKKAIWGPARVDGVSQFPIYDDLGARIYQMHLDWPDVAPTRPANPTDPSDPAYRWPADVDFAIAEGRRYGIRVLLLVQRAPGWANGGRLSNWAPVRAQDFADFATAAARRYPQVRLWMIWGEPSRKRNFRPLTRVERDRQLSRRSRRGPRLYARILDASYAALKRQNRRNLVIGGNTFTVGDVSPLNFMKAMRLPGGRRPRMDLYGHNPFSARKPDLKRDPIIRGYADFSDLDTLARWLDRYLGGPGGRRLRLFLSEFTLPTDHFNWEFAFYVTRRAQADWLAAALRITRHWRRIYALGWTGLYDDPPRPGGDEVNRGLIDRKGRKKPSYFAYKRG